MRQLSCLAFGFALWTTATAAAPPMSLRIAFAPCDTVSSEVRADAVEEAARVWAPYGVDIASASKPGDTGLAATLLVTLDTLRRAGDGDEALGAIRFSSDGIPDSRLTLFYRAVAQLATTAPAMGTDLRLSPPKLQDLMISRALGRALAHEVGHFVLRSPHHEPVGLMRARQHASNLVDPTRKDFALTDVARARLQVVLAAQPAALAQR